MELKEAKEKGFKEWLRSENFVLITLFSILIPLMVHTATLLLQVSMVKNVYYAYFFAFGLDLAIFMHAIHGHQRAAAGLAFIVFLTNMAFYNLDTFNKHLEPEWVKLCVTLIFAGTSAYLVHSYVEIYSYKNDSEEEQVNLYAQIKQLKQKISDQEDTITEYNELVKEHHELKTTLAVRDERISILEAHPRESFLKIADDDTQPSKEIKDLVITPVPLDNKKKLHCSAGCGKTFQNEKSFQANVLYCSYPGGCKSKHILQGSPIMEESLVNT